MRAARRERPNSAYSRWVRLDEFFAVEQDGECGGLGEDADVGGDGEAGEIESVEECGVDGDGEQGGDGSGDGRGAGVAGGVEGAGVDALHGPDGERDGEDGEEMRGGCASAWLKRPPRKRSMSQGARAIIQAETIMPTAKRRETERPTEAEKSWSAALLEERGEEGERGGSGGGADDIEGRVEEVFGVADEGDAAVTQRGEVVEEDAVEHDERDADHERKREVEPLEKGGIAEADDGAIVEAGAERADGVEQGGADEHAREHADGKGGDAELAVEEDGAEDDAGVVDDRGEGLVEEDLADLQARAHDAADEEEELAGKDEAGDGSAERGFGGIVAEAFIGEQDVLRGEDLGEQHANAEDDEHGGEDDGECAVAPFFVAGFAVAVEDGDERDGGGAADEEVGEQVREFEGGAVGVLGDAGAEERVDVFDADESEHAGEDGREHEENRGGECGVRCRETEQSQEGAVGSGGFEMTGWGTAGSGMMGSSRGSSSGLESSFVATGDLILSVEAYAVDWLRWFAIEERDWRTFG